MKIGILTLPFSHNYGNILQAYALQHVLEKLGHDVVFIFRAHNQSKWHTLINLYYFIRFNIASLYYNHTFISLSSFKSRKRIFEQKNQQIISTLIPHHSPTLTTNKELQKWWITHKKDAVIVGSDQIWRPKYAREIENYYLDFVKDDTILRVAYAASFGVDEWEYSPKQTQQCKTLAKLFTAISTRESSGVSLCKQYLDVDAQWVLDPTLLLEQRDYLKLFPRQYTNKNELFSYILDPSPFSNKIVDEISAFTHWTKISWQYEMDLLSAKPTTKPDVTQWLQAYETSNMIITDSFHGVVFSIIFEKPFWVILNQNRGCSRFISLLKLFELENRIISSELPQNWLLPINWERIREIKQNAQTASMQFLNQSLIPQAD